MPRNNPQNGTFPRQRDTHGGWAEEVAVAEGVPFIDLNELIAQHNDWYPVERDLPLNPRTGDYVRVGGRYRIELHEAEQDPHLPEVRRRYHEATGAGPSAGPDPVLLSVDSHRIRELLLNLVTNAVKYTPGGGQIRLSAGRERGSPPPAPLEHEGCSRRARRTRGSGVSSIICTA